MKKMTKEQQAKRHKVAQKRADYTKARLAKQKLLKTIAQEVKPKD